MTTDRRSATDKRGDLPDPRDAASTLATTRRTFRVGSGTAGLLAVFAAGTSNSPSTNTSSAGHPTPIPTHTEPDNGCTMSVKIYFEQYGSPKVLQQADEVVPEPGDGEVRIVNRAISVNPVDWKVVAGYLKEYRPVPRLFRATSRPV